MKKNVFLFLFAFFIFSVFLTFVSSEGCCLMTKDGASFQNVNEEFCATPDFFSEGILCEDSTFINNEGLNLADKGCCIDYNNFECSPYVYRDTCDSSGLLFENSVSGSCNDISLNPNSCSIGCCVVDGKGYYENEMSCDARSFGGDIDFRNINENECSLIERSGEKGACVSEIYTGNCQYLTRESCLSDAGDFKGSGIYCSDESLKSEVSCTARASTGCSEIQGEEDVYYFDSCGNPEGISSECSPGISKCDLGENREYQCKSLSCISSIDGESLKNGESRCVYEGVSEEGESYPGSTHYVEECFEGDIEINYCGGGESGRDSVCRETITQGTESVKAACTSNFAEICYLIDGQFYERINERNVSYEVGMSELKEECEGVQNCKFLQSDIDNSFGYGLCVPKESKSVYNVGEESEGLCSIATSTCTVYFAKNDFNKYECVENCECLTEKSFLEMNNLCTSVGDCGLDINFKGDVGSNLLSYSPEEGKRLERPFSDGTIDAWDAIGAYDSDCSGGFCSKNQNKVNKWQFYIHLGEIVIPNVMNQILGILGEKEVLVSTDGNKIIVGGNFSGSIEEIVSLNQQIWFGEIDSGNSLLKVGGFILEPGLSLTFNIARAITGKGEIATIDIQYICSDWQAVSGGENCEECNEGDLSCTKYKCEKFGAACEFMESEGLCVSAEDNGRAPKIESIKSISEDYEIRGVYTNSWSLDSLQVGTSECVGENTNLEFGVSVDEYSRCKYSFIPSDNYGLMQNNYPLENGISLNHVFDVPIGSIFDYISGEEEDAYYNCVENGGSSESCIVDSGISEVDLVLDLFCEDRFGHSSDKNSIDFCIKTEPDNSPPKINLFSPSEGQEFEFNPGEINLKIYTDERAECVYDYNNKLNYEDFLYDAFIQGKVAKSWLHVLSLDKGLQGNNQIFIRCNDTSGNIGDYVYEYRIKRDITKEEYVMDFGLRIDSILLENNVGGMQYNSGESIITGKSPSFTLKVTTSRGVNQGVANCYLDSNKRVLMKTTGSTGHSQIYNSFNQGNHSLFVVCSDGLIETNSTINFGLIVDSQSPTIVSSSMDGDYLNINTNEKAKCSYENDDADFLIEEGNAFYETGYSLNHTTSWNPSERYYIRCVDEYGNKGFAGEVGEGPQEGPIITRINYIGNNLIIKTDRDSTCYYNIDKCDFNVVNESDGEMSSRLTKEHSLRIDPAENYFLKCKDQYEIVNPVCTSINIF